MKRIFVIAGVAVLANAGTVNAVPVVPNFTQGSMTSVTTQTVTTNETINSMDYATGWTYSVSGSNGVTSTWTGLDLSTANKPNWKQSEAGAAFQFTEHYSGPGLQTHTIIQRETTVQSVTESTSIFSN